MPPRARRRSRAMEAAATMATALLVLVLLLARGVVAPQTPPPGQTSGTCEPNIETSCLSRIAFAYQGKSTVLTGLVLNNITAQVLACAGAGAAVSSLRPVNVLMPTEIQTTLARITPVLRALLGWDIKFDYMPFNDLGGAVLASIASLGRTYYDGWTCSTMCTVDVVEAGMVAPLDTLIQTDSALDVADFLSFLRSSAAVYNGSIIGLPVSSFIQHMFYRTDVLARAGLEPPNTWRELIDVARALNGSDFDGDGVGEHALCIALQPLPTVDAGVVLAQVLASITQTQGTATGWLFDPYTLKSFVDTPAMLEALDIVRQLLPYNLDLQSVDAVESNPFVQRKCALQIHIINSFKSAQLVGKLGGLIGTSVLPGSTIVLDRATGQLVPCTPRLCPYATWVNGVGVNRAAYSGYTAGLMMLNINAASTYQAAAYSLSSLFTLPTYSTPNVIASGWIGPFRYTHLCVTPQCLARWTAAGYNARDTAQYLNATRRVADDPNYALDLRIQHAGSYRDALVTAMGLLRNATWTVAEIQAATSTTFAAVMALTPLQEVGDAYLAGLNLRRRFVLPSPPPPPLNPAYSAAAPPGAAAGSSSGLSAGAQAGIIAAACVGAALLAAGAAYATVAWRMKRRRQGLLGPAKAPGAGPGTTLVVTDIEGSTTLWETLPQEVMNEALDLHHKLVRKLLHQHAGHEADTEGDSFIIAFSTPWDALAFGQALQEGLMPLHWPAQLLQCASASPAYMMSTNDADANELWGAVREPSMHVERPTTAAGVASPPTSTTLWSSRSAVREPSAIMRSALSALVESPFAQRQRQQRPAPARNSSFAAPPPPSAGSATEGGMAARVASHKMQSRNSKSIIGALPFFAKIDPALSLEGSAASSAQLSFSRSPRAERYAVPTAPAPQQPRYPVAADIPPQTSAHYTSAPNSAQTPAGGSGGLASGKSVASSVGAAVTRSGPLALEAMSHLFTARSRHLATKLTTAVSLEQGMAQAQNVLEVLWRSWEECGPSTVEGGPAVNQRLVLRGLRVRVGLHSGLSEEDVVEDPEKKARTKYVGRALSMAKAVCDCGHGGMVLLSEACYGALVPASGLAAFGHMLHLGDYEFTVPGASPGAVYWAVATDMQPRVPLLLKEPLRGAVQVEMGALDAPAGHAAVVFVNVVGAAALSAWDAAVAGRAFAQLHEQARRLLSQPCGLQDGEVNGYAVKTAEGLCLCAFACPRSAVLWALHLVNELKASVAWEPALLQHELCEEVQLDATEFLRQHTRHGSTRSSRSVGAGHLGVLARAERRASSIIAGSAAVLEEEEGEGDERGAEEEEDRDRASSSPRPRDVSGPLDSRLTSDRHASTRSQLMMNRDHVLFRGLRLKVGVDAGRVQANLIPSTGRVDYRGRVMNRTARIAAKAQAGQVWASKVAWELAQEKDVEGLLEPRPLGPVALKGVAEPVELVQCKLASHEL